MLAYQGKKIGCEEGYYYCIYDEEKISIVSRAFANRLEREVQDYQYWRTMDTGGMTPEHYEELMKKFDHEENYETNKLAINKRLKEGEPSFIMPDEIVGRKLTGVMKEAFMSCKVLRKMSLAEGILEIGEGAFKGCDQLQEVYMNDRVKIIKKQAFKGCTSLQEIELPDQLECIEEEAFKDCNALAKVMIPMCVKSIGEGAFEGTPLMEEEHWENGALYIGHWLIKVKDNFEGEFSVRENTVGIAAGAFKGCMQLISVYMPESVCYIGRNSLSGCRALKKAKLPSHVVYMDRYAIDDCRCLEEINLPEGLTSLGGFTKCKVLKTINIPDTVTELWEDSFRDCSELSHIKLSSRLKRVGSNTFMHTAYWRNKENWQDHMLYLGEWLIAIQKGLSDSVTVPEGIKGIADSVFYCRGWVYDDEMMEEIEGMESMEACDSDKVKEIHLPTSLRYIGRDAFEDCSYLESINIPRGVKWLKRNVFSGCINLKRLRLPSSVERIDESAIENCNKLEQLIIENPQIRMARYSVDQCKRLSIHTLAGSTASDYAKHYKIRLVEYQV